MSVYRMEMPWGDEVRFDVDLTQQTSQIKLLPDEEGWEIQSIPYQSADARHCKDAAAELVLQWLGREWYASPDDERDDDDILEELMESVEVEEVPGKEGPEPEGNR